MYTPPVTPWKSVTPEAGELTQEAAVEGGIDDWGEVVTRVALVAGLNPTSHDTS